MDASQNTKGQIDVTENRHAATFGVGIGFIVFDSVVVALRIYARAFMLRALGTDDSKSLIPRERPTLTALSIDDSRSSKRLNRTADDLYSP